MTVYLYYLIWHLCANEIFVRRSSWTDILLRMLLIVALNFPPEAAGTSRVGNENDCLLQLTPTRDVVSSW